MEEAIKEVGIPCHDTDNIAKELIWEQNYKVDPDVSGKNKEDCMRLYTDGSKLDNLGGFGATLLDPEDIELATTKGSLGLYSTVFQAECKTITHGLRDCLPNELPQLTILTDNQALVKSL